MGFVNALEWRIERPFGGPGTSLAWLRLAQPLVAGGQTTPLEQCVAIAGTANGVGARLDAHTYPYLNTDLTSLLDWRPSRREPAHLRSPLRCS